MLSWRRHLNLECLAIPLLFLFHTVAAYTSFGYHHPDEHFQILDFANVFLGLNTDLSRLPWEYSQQIRPWFQPLLHVLVMKPMIALGIYSPFTAAFLFHLLYSWVNCFALIRLWNYFKKSYALDPIWILWISILWFFPYLHVRTSSENLAGIFSTFAMLSLLDQKHYFKSGVYFGFAFLARYQIALGLSGLALSMLILERKIIRDHFVMFLGFLLPVALGVVLDRIGYGTWVLTTYRYFKVNITDGVAAQFNPYPWYQYFIWILQLLPPVSLPLFFGSILFLTRGKRKDRAFLGGFVWSFFLLHCFMTNKEYRFLFPVLNLIPFMTAVSFQGWTGSLYQKRLWIPYGVLSLLAFAISTLHGASLNTSGAVFIAHRNLDPSRPVLTSRDYSRQLSFFSFPAHGLTIFETPEMLLNELSRTSAAQILIDGRFEEPKLQSELEIMNSKGCVLKDSALPPFLYRAYDRVKAIGHLQFTAWFDCKR